jgi:hypothetical protein
MSAGGDPLLTNLERIVATSRDRRASLEEVAALIRSSGNYRWVEVRRTADPLTSLSG